MSDPTGRFSNRAENYARYRPCYPQALLDLLKEECGLAGSSVIADVGSGTGILSELFLKNGNLVFGVEPNDEMRAAAERLLSRYPDFTSVVGRAEATTLGDGSADFVTAGQAFHWFDPAAAGAEFARILKPRGHVVLAWNSPREHATPFMEACERLYRDHSTDRGPNQRRTMDETESIRAFFEPVGFRFRTFENTQPLSKEGLQGLLSSSSYMPAEGTPSAPEMLRAAAEVFDTYEYGGVVLLEYETSVYLGQLQPPTCS
jgi:SAM-dependent methyltransferase